MGGVLFANDGLRYNGRRNTDASDGICSSASYETHEALEWNIKVFSVNPSPGARSLSRPPLAAYVVRVSHKCMSLPKRNRDQPPNLFKSMIEGLKVQHHSDIEMPAAFVRHRFRLGT